MRILANFLIKMMPKPWATIKGTLRRDWRQMCTSDEEKSNQVINNALCKHEPTRLELCPDEKELDPCKQITLDENEDLIPLHPEVPCEYLSDRVAYIRKRTKHVMQQGTSNTHSWILTYNYTKSWENPLMGWRSTGDCLSPLDMVFTDVNSAIRHCEKFGWKYVIEEEPPIKKPFKVKSYAANFTYKKRTRVSTK